MSYFSRKLAPGFVVLVFTLIASNVSALTVEQTDASGVTTSVEVADDSAIANALARIQAGCAATPDTCSNLLSQEMAALNAAGLGGYTTSVFNTAVSALKTAGLSGNDLASNVTNVFTSLSNSLRSSSAGDATRDIAIMSSLIDDTRVELDNSGADASAKNSAIAKVAVNSLVTLSEKASTLPATSPVLVSLNGLANSSTDLNQASAIASVLNLVAQGQNVLTVLTSGSVAVLSTYASPA